MAAAETARLIASLELQDKNFTRGIRNVERGVSRVDRKLGAFSGFVNRNMGRAIDSIALRFTQSIGTGLESLAELEDATTAVTGSITQVGKDWTTTGEDIATWANEIEADTEAAFDDKAIVAATNTLIRYGKVSEKNLRPAMEVMTDLAAKTGDEGSAATLLARALADPAKAAGKLARAGVILTKAQQKQIKAMVKTGDVAGAQTLLLEILGETTKGAAKSSAGPFRDAMNQMADAVEDAQRALAVGFLPVIKEVASFLTTELAKKSTIAAIKDFSMNLGKGVKGLIGIVKSVDWGAVAGFLGTAAGFAGQLVGWFQKMPDWAQAFLIGGFVATKLPIVGDLISELGKGLIKGVLGMTAGVVNLKAGTVIGGGGTPVPGGKGGGKGPLGLGLKGVGGLLVGATGVGLAAIFASEFEDEIQGLSTDIGNGWRDWLRTNADINIPTISPKDIEWPFGPKNTPTILPEVFGGNGLLGGTPTAPGRAPGSRTGARPRGSEQPPIANLTPIERAITTNLVPKVQRVGTLVGTTTTAINAQGAATKAQIANATSIASRENSAIKSTVATMDANQRAAILAQTAVNVAGNVSAIMQSASQVLAQAGTTQAVNTNASATRGVAPPITAAVYAIGSSIAATIWAARPVIQSTNVVNNYTTQQRTGSSSGSRYNRWE